MSRYAGARLRFFIAMAGICELLPLAYNVRSDGRQVTSAMFNRFLSFAYWFEADPGPLSAVGRALYLLVGTLLAAGAFVSGLRWWRRRRSFWLAEAFACSVGLAAAALRLASVPGWLARGWVAAPAALAFVFFPALAALAPDWAALRLGWSQLWRFEPLAMELKPQGRLALLLLHAIGILVAVRMAAWPLWATPVLLLVLIALQLPSSRRRPRRALSPLAWNALAPAYLLAVLAAAGRVALRIGWWQQAPVLPVGPALAILAACAWAYQLYTLWPAARRAFAWAPAALASGVGLAWAAWACFTLYARGVTGSDPYCYVQMAVDLARYGTVLHRFPLAPLAEALQIDLEPVLHVGYRLPLQGGEWAPTVWPVGHSVLLGLAGKLAGEQAIYLATPLMALASIGATAWLGALLFRDLPQPSAWLGGAVAGLLLATSFEQLRWTLVHMADISAQLFSCLTIALTWLGTVRARRRTLAAAGLALAMAYWIRHTQLAMALPALALVATADPQRPRRARLGDGAAYLGASLLGAVPDLWYHTLLFGSPLRPESKELALYALRAVPATTLLTLRECLSQRELLYFAPFLLAGTLFLARHNRRAGLALALWLGGLWAVQAPYSSLRVRDLLPALPALTLLAGYGVAALLHRAARWRRQAATVVALAAVGLFWLRTADTALLPWRHNFNNFGYLWPSQRQEFMHLQTRIEPDAVVGATLNTGAVDLYAGRDAFVPTGWTPGDLRRFLQALGHQGRPAYLLNDGTEMGAVLTAVQAYARISPVATLRQIPFYAPDGGSELKDVVLYRVETGE